MRGCLKPVELADHEVAAIVRHALDEAPREACGLIVECRCGGDSRRTLLQARNVQDEVAGPAGPDATRAFTVDPETLAATAGFVEHGARVAVIYHSHTNGYRALSEEDRRQAAPEGRPLYPGAIHLLVLPAADDICDLKGYTWDRGEYRLVNLVIVNRDGQQRLAIGRRRREKLT